MSWRVDAVDREVGEDLADDRAELVAVAREPGADDCRWRVRVAVDEEVLVGGGLEEAGLERHGRPGAVGEVALGEGAERRLVLECGLPRDRVRVTACSEVVVATELEAGDAVRREAVEVLAVEREIEDGHPVGLEELGPRRLEPGEGLADTPDEPGR